MHISGLAGVALILSGCVSTEITIGYPRKKGPPPHAPAHGYRRKNEHGLEIIFDSKLGVYIMMDYPMHYYWDNRYYRKQKDKWETSIDINKKWKSIDKQQLPKGLQNR
jgi:hypothetical protein